MSWLGWLGLAFAYAIIGVLVYGLSLAFPY